MSILKEERKRKRNRNEESGQLMKEKINIRRRKYSAKSEEESGH
jgi:hypothetical protein